jgi:uncharacterized protein (DUF1697 family)
MPQYFAFLRAVNLGGRKISMERLRELFESLGLKGVETFITSGNVIFEAPAGAATLDRRIEQHLEKALGYPVETFLRSGPELASIARYKPFRDPPPPGGTLSVGFIRDPVPAAAARALIALDTDMDDFHCHGREVYWRIQGTVLDAKVSNAKLERALQARATFRNVNTVLRLVAKYAAKHLP